MSTLAGDHAQRAMIAFLWALALERFRDYVQAKQRGTDVSDQELTTERTLDTPAAPAS
jgi:hypothetical protein